MIDFAQIWHRVSARDSQYVVQGQRVKGQGHSVRNSQQRFTSNTRVVSLLIYRVRASMRMPIEYSGRICCTWPLLGALRKTSENNIFKPNKPEKIPERLARCRSAVEMQCFRNCTLSSLLLTRSVAPRDQHLWLTHGTSQNAIFSICQIDWREVGVAFELQCFCNCTLSSQTCTHTHYGLYVNVSK